MTAMPTRGRLPAAAALALAAVLALTTTLHAQETPTPTAQTTLETVAASLDRIEELRADVARLEAAETRSEGDARRILSTRIEKKQLEILTLTHDAAEAVVGLDEDAAAEVSEIRGPVLEAFERLPDELHTAVSGAAEEWHATDTQGRELTPAEESQTLESRRHIVRRLDDLYRALLGHIRLGERLGLDVAEERARLVKALEGLAETSSVFLELAAERASSVAARAKMIPTDGDLQLRLGVAHSRVRGAAEHLKTLVRMMDELEMDTAEYQQQVIAATGELDAAVLDIGLVERLVAKAYRSGTEWLGDNGSRALFKSVLVLLILLASWSVARLAGRLVRRALESERFDVSQLLKRVVVSSVRRLVLLLGVLIALAQVGVSIGPLLAGLGVAGFIVGFALQDTLSNFASGLFILLYRPYDVGDAVEAAGVLGTVSNMSLVNTTIKTFDNQRIVVPNSKIWGDVIKNITAEDVRRVDLVFGISYGDDIPQAEAVLAEVLRSHDKVLEDPAPVVRLHELADSSVNFVVRPWTRTSDYWEVYWDVTREVKLRFDREGISIPFPQRDVHLVTEAAAETAAS